MRLRLLLTGQRGFWIIATVCVTVVAFSVATVSYIEAAGTQAHLPTVVLSSAQRILTAQEELQAIIAQYVPDEVRQKPTELLRQIRDSADTIRSYGAPRSGGLVSSAVAAENSRFTVEDARPYAMIFILIVLGLTFIGCVAAILYWVRSCNSAIHK